MKILPNKINMCVHGQNATENNISASQIIPLNRNEKNVTKYFYKPNINPIYKLKKDKAKSNYKPIP